MTLTHKRSPGSRQVCFFDLKRLSSSANSPGHYARKDWSSCAEKPRPRLLHAATRNKDQSYYLSSITENGLRRALFPLGHLNKPQVRELAQKYRLPTAERPESMGICFVGEKARFGEFICMLDLSFNIRRSLKFTSIIYTPEARSNI